MTFPTDALYKFLAVVGFVVMSACIAAWMKDRAELQSDLMEVARASAAAVEIQERILGHMQHAEDLVSMAETNASNARKFYAEGDDESGDKESNESSFNTRIGKESLANARSLLSDYGDRSLQFKQAAAVADARSSGHAGLRWALGLGFLVGLATFVTSCLAWQRTALMAKPTEA